MASRGQVEGAAALMASFALGMAMTPLAGLVPAGATVLGGAAGLLVLGALLGCVVWRRRSRSKLALERLARRDAEERVHHLARHDALTGLLNRPIFNEQLSRMLEGTRRDDRRVAVMILDIQDFNAINGAFGHAAGDLLLRHAAARLLACLRDTDVIARMGADEFSIAQSALPNPAAAVLLAERLLAAIEEPFDLMGQAVPARASVGIAIYPDDGDQAEVLLRHANLALQRAKQAAPGTAAFFEEGMDAEVRRRKALECDLHQAIERDELELYYQPQVDLDSRRIVGMEALSRWHHPEHGSIPPDVFIPLAEDCGLIGAIGSWALEEACRQLRRWQIAGARDLRMSVNLSPVQLLRPEFVDEVAAILERTGVEPNDLELEITERILISDDGSTQRSLSRLRAMGVRISVDDFGAGHASLGYLQRFAFDEIKVDRAFIGGLGREPSSTAILRAALIVGRSLGMNVVAEGVEDEEQLKLVVGEACPVAQGYYFSPPRPAVEIDHLIEASITTQPFGLENKVKHEVGVAS